MNEVALSSDISRIETEIQFYKEKAGESIWEIGRRLNHVKNNDLAHGDFMNWLEEIGIEHTSAKRMMKVANELPKSATLHHLGASALYLIATLPEEERDVEHVTADGDIKTPDEMTVRELQDLKKQLKEKEKTIKEQQKIIDQQADAEPEVKIVEVEKEAMHPHIEDLKSDNDVLSEALKEAREKERAALKEAQAAKERNEFIEKELKKLYEQRAEVNEKSDKYDQLTEAIKNAEGKLDSTQKLVSDYKKILQIIRQGNEALLKVSGLVYMDIAETVNQSSVVSREFDSLIRSLERIARDLRSVRDENVLEGEFINE